MHTFFGASMAMASFCGIETWTGLAESCLSLFMERRNFASVSMLPALPTLCCECASLVLPRTFMMTVGAPAVRPFYATRTWYVACAHEQRKSLSGGVASTCERRSVGA